MKFNTDYLKESARRNSPLGVYVGVDNPLSLPAGWSRYISFRFELVNQDPSKTLSSQLISEFYVCYCGYILLSNLL